MPRTDQYTVEITVRVRDGFHEGPAEALEAAITKLKLDKAAIISTHVFQRSMRTGAAA